MKIFSLFSYDLFQKINFQGLMMSLALSVFLTLILSLRLINHLIYQGIDLKLALFWISIMGIRFWTLSLPLSWALSLWMHLRLLKTSRFLDMMASSKQSIGRVFGAVFSSAFLFGILLAFNGNFFLPCLMHWAKQVNLSHHLSFAPIQEHCLMQRGPLLIYAGKKNHAHHLHQVFVLIDDKEKFYAFQGKTFELKSDKDFIRLDFKDVLSYTLPTFSTNEFNLHPDFLKHYPHWSYSQKGHWIFPIKKLGQKLQQWQDFQHHSVSSKFLWSILKTFFSKKNHEKHWILLQKWKSEIICRFFLPFSFLILAIWAMAIFKGIGTERRPAWKENLWWAWMAAGLLAMATACIFFSLK